MAIIEVGSINNFSVSVKKDIPEASMLESVSTFSELDQVSKSIEPNSFELITSKDQRGLYLKKLKLEKGFGGFLNNLLGSTNNIYFIAWAWDLSGEPVNLYPGKDVQPESVLIPMKAGNVREFIGNGIVLFPKRYVKGGIALRIQIWESDQEIRKFGKAVNDTSEAIKNSKLNNLLSLISLGTGVSGVTISLVKDAAIELGGIIGTILKSNGDDYVDFFEGYYSSDDEWIKKDEIYKGNSSQMTLQKN
ncbi:hypothetical protein [Flavobacterium panacagri]|uniref:hypothetical protein n=1 Tax=Flavobacterium panacagri TaxID=3034146 RepID=UPI0025A5A0C2|nr:hypothetical protein [Flavobacterium panacagri]